MKYLRESSKKEREETINRVRQEQDDFIRNYEEFRKEHRTLMAPVGVIYDEKLTPQAKLLFLIISGLSFKLGYCFATNEGLSERLCLGTTCVKKYLKELEKEKLIYYYKYRSSGKFRRKIYIVFEEMFERYETIEQESATREQKGSSVDNL